MPNSCSIEIAGSAIYCVDRQQSTHFFCSNRKHIAEPTLTELIPGLNLRRIPTSSKLALHMAALTIHFAGASLPFDIDRGLRTGIFIGSGHGPVQSSFQFNDSILDDGPALASPTAFSYSVNNIFASILTNSMNIRGPSISVSQFGLSAAATFCAACTNLYSGAIDEALVGVVEENDALLEAAYLSSLPKVQMPLTSGCAFFYLSTKKTGNRPLLEHPCWDSGQTGDADLYFNSGLLEQNEQELALKKSLNLDLTSKQIFFPALDIACATHTLAHNTSKNTSSIICQTLDPITKKFAAIKIYKAKP